MRELELWKDKVRCLVQPFFTRLADGFRRSSFASVTASRILSVQFAESGVKATDHCVQMEQFTRECLDLDREAETDKGVFAGTSMEQVYLRAARLVKRTLDVEGAIVLDVSHVDVVETVGAESSMAVTVHNADRQAGAATVTKSLSKEEYARLQEFYTKNPEGKICEGIVPAMLKPFLPQRIQYALGTCG